MTAGIAEAPPLPAIVRELLSTGSDADLLRPRRLRFEEYRRAVDPISLPLYAHAARVHQPLRSAQRLDFIEVFVVEQARGCRVVIRTKAGVRHAPPARRGQVFLFRPSDVTSLATAPHATLAGLSVMIPMPVWDAYVAFVGLPEVSWRADDPPVATLDDADPVALRPFRDAVAHAQGSPSRVDALRFLVDVVPGLFPPTPTTSAGVVAPAWLVQGVDAMRGNEDHLRGGVARLTELTHVSGQYLASSMRRFYGTTPSLLVRRLRLERAAILLTTTAHSISEIADRCGYPNLPYFSTSFRDAYGLTPREYRARRSPAHSATLA